MISFEWVALYQWLIYWSWKIYDHDIGKNSQFNPVLISQGVFLFTGNDQATGDDEYANPLQSLSYKRGNRFVRMHQSDQGITQIRYDVANIYLIWNAYCVGYCSYRWLYL